ncbi:hypothetical protein ABZ820_14700 [Streptomyces diacarni]|uniref:WXG100 family type VII secretion target n=1 Tax=Streptomyces diacarni TaxID=2800381 RepID=A0A367ESY8_9ACTN|nr:hypothetical protein [Streptomyces diacarni]RCG21204.1 hypothetical protein DTL70_17165 [Streptomyces diacarni]
MSGYHNNYQADLVGLDQTFQQLDGMAGAPKRLLDDFDRSVEATRWWNGTDDDFHDETEDQDQRQIESCRKFVGSLEMFTAGLQSAVRKSMGSIEGVHTDVQDQIHDAQQNAGSYDTGGGGKR